MNDEKLAKHLKQKPSKGLTCAIEIYGPLVKTIVTRILGYENKQDIEECISDVFVELWKSIDKFDSNKGILKNYIISIARFRSINMYNRKIIKAELLPLEDNDLQLDLDLDKEVSENIEWTVTFKADYKNTTDTINVNKKAKIQDKRYTVKNIKLSPISLNVKLINNLLDYKEDTNHDSFDEVSVVMKDGSLAEVSSRGSSTNSLTSTINLIFNQPIDIKQIDIVKIGDLEIEINYNK